MSPAADLAKQAEKYTELKDYSNAIEALTRALKEIPTSIDYHIKRSTAYHCNKQYEEALKDAEAAVYLADLKGKREQKGLGQLRRGITLFRQGQPENSYFALRKAEECIPNNNMLASWLLKVKMAIEKVECEKECTIREIPCLRDLDNILQAEIEKIQSVEVQSEINTEKKSVNEKEKSNIRYEWYQNDDTVTITLYAKSVDKNTLKKEFKERSLSVTFFLPVTQENYTFELAHLYGEIDALSSVFTVYNTKIEMKLKKRYTEKWLTLETEIPDTQTINKNSNKSNLYPSSSKYGSKDWDLLSRTMVTEKDETEDTALNKLFQEIYANADDDTKRAMMKSYIESNGTALSTNWKEVGSKRVEVQPPTGMEVKPWYH
ncbi:hypothetical protein T552_01018 [Pneumocystis carinii B80]|uniref:SGS domain-containing protein n=1 Tax=Pneumocystis carinii (strain B80) TaxID=1408658 RepID=A0A0W4ZN59_PNEC8|nr:hypothetical protein T552_01018 [Pneumocystis carinii B80]KTW29813.1 hypothetical protein T552_01018 [Pneumocystis carinii B80]